MPPPLSWLLTTTLLMTSLLMLVEGASKITITNGCPASSTTCIAVDDSASASSLKDVSCKPDYILETSDIKVNKANNEAQLKAACYSKCDKKYLKHECPSYSSSTDCGKAKDGVVGKLSCADQNKKLYINGIEFKGSSTCDTTKGWKDDKKSGAGAVIPFKANEFPSILVYCSKPPPTPTALCDDTSYEKNSALRYANKKLTCGDGISKLVVAASSLTDFKLVDSAMCDASGWKGPAQETLVDFATNPGAKIRADCYKFSCAVLYKCTAGSNCQFTAASKLTCMNGALLEINGQWMKEAECSQQKGWTSGQKILLKYTDYPYPKIKATCHDDCDDSLWEDDCPSCVEKPAYDPAKKELTCSPGNDLIIDGSITAKKATCSIKGWTLDSLVAKHKDYTTSVEKLKAKCTPSVPVTTHAPLTTIHSTPSLPSTTTATPDVTQAASTGKKKDAAYIAVICVLFVALLLSLVLLFLTIRKNRRMSDDDTEGDSKSRSKKNDKKKGKKGSKKKNDKSKNGKKNKKKEDVEDVPRPEHEMSAPDSTVPLTARVMAMETIPGHNPNVMDV